MKTPSWIPPIDCELIPEERTRQLLREYAALAVGAYKASLKPVAWIRRRTADSTLLFVDGEMIRDGTERPLFLLDDQP
jgi:hypothetical protein